MHSMRQPPNRPSRPKPPPVWNFLPGQIACQRHRLGRTAIFFRVLAIDEGHTVVREIAASWHDSQGAPILLVINGVAKDYHDIVPLELPTITEITALRSQRDDVPEDTPTVENH
mgnify:CR=1 FL=1